MLLTVEQSNLITSFFATQNRRPGIDFYGAGTGRFSKRYG